MIRTAGAACAFACATACVPSLPWTTTSPDHRVRVDVRTERGRSCLTGNGRRACHDAIALDGVAFSARGDHLAYPARDAGRWTIVRDGRPGPSWDAVGAPVFSPDGARLAYVALDGGAWRVVVNDTASGPVDSVVAGTLRFDPRGRRLAWIASAGSAVRVVIDGRGGPPHAAVRGVALGDSGRVAYAALDGGQWRVFLDGEPVGAFDAVRAPAFAPGGSAPLFAARTGRAERVYHGSTAVSAAWDSVGAPVFSPGGRHWAVVGWDSGGAAVLVDGAVVARETWAGNALVTDAGQPVYLARREGRSLVVAGADARPFELVVDGTLVLLADGRTWACLAGEPRRRRLFVVVAGGEERRAFDWQANSRLAERPDAAAALRAWVAAEAELVLAGRSSGRAERP